MRYIFIILSIFLLPISAVPAEYKVNEFNSHKNDDSQFIELQIEPEGGKSFSDIFSALFHEKYNKLAIRILGSLPQNTQEELMAFYKNQIPGDLEKALKSGGNLHNPALAPLIALFPDALRETTLLQDIEKALNTQGYDIIQIGFEKFTIHNKEISVPDIWLKCVRREPDQSQSGQLAISCQVVVPEEYRQDPPGWVPPNGEPESRRYRKSYEAFWWNCVRIKARDLEGRCPFSCGGTPAASRGALDGARDAERQVKQLIEKYDEKRVRGYLRSLADSPEGLEKIKPYFR